MRKLLGILLLLTVSLSSVWAKSAPFDSQPPTFYGGYRTVGAHYAHMYKLEKKFPQLARVVDFGESWVKTITPLDGYDMLAICITAEQPEHCALNPQSSKPRFVLMAAVHPRELTPAEVAWRWMDYLLGNYGIDPDVTALLDHNEMWIIPIANPDGRKIVESGGLAPYYQRKNAHFYEAQSSCHTPPITQGDNHIGVDLNRNGEFGWGITPPRNACAEIYAGPTPASEPEQQALQGLVNHLFVDQRIDDILPTTYTTPVTIAAPLTTTGTFVSVHSTGDVVVFPWAWRKCETNRAICPLDKRAPNDAGLRSLSFRMSYFNGYDAGAHQEAIGTAAGTMDDYVYGMLGVASFTYEIGDSSDGPACDGFMPDYSCQDSIFWPENREALMYAAVTARQPYAMSRGPSVTHAVLSYPIDREGVQLDITADDTVYGVNNPHNYNTRNVERPTSQPINAIEYYLDQAPWTEGAQATQLAPIDGLFDSRIELASTTIPIYKLNAGRHEVWIRAQDRAGFWGPPVVRWIDIPATDVKTIDR